jgi:hypothetical protein
MDATIVLLRIVNLAATRISAADAVCGHPRGQQT